MRDQSTPSFKTIFQPAKGYRYGIDSFLLARFARFQKSDSVCDLGSGVGILGILAVERFGVQEVTAIEIQEGLAQMAIKNARKLGLEDRFKVLNLDWREILKKKKIPKFNVVISNPPYRKQSTGRLSSGREMSIAKHEIHGTMGDLILCAKKILKPKGRFYVMYPPLRLEELIQELNQVNFKIQRMAMIHPYGDRPASQVMVEAVLASNREMILEPPVIVYLDRDRYRPEIEAWVGPKRRH